MGWISIEAFVVYTRKYVFKQFFNFFFKNERILDVKACVELNHI